MGGKYYLAGWLSRYIPEHVTYVEPFCGAGHLLFSKTPSPVEVLNDLDNNLVNLYRCIQNAEKRQKLINILNETPYSRSVFQNWRYGDEMTLNDIEKAGRYFFLCKASFAGDVERGGFGMPSKGTGRNPARTFRTAIDSLDIIADRLKNAVIECLDYADCIQRYDSPGSLFFCDPPYLSTEDYYGKGCFTLEDHRKLAELLHGIKGHVMVTHYHSLPLITRIACMMIYTRAGKGTSISHSREVIKRSWELKNRKRWKSYIVILNQSKQGGYSMRWNNFNNLDDFLLWVVSFKLTRAVCWMLATSTPSLWQ